MPITDTAGQAGHPLLRMRLLGDLSVGEPGFGHIKPLALLALVVASPEGAVPREQAAAFLWPDSAPGAARSALRQALHQLRRHLPEDTRHGPVVLADRTRLWRNPDYPLDTDLDRFLAAVRADTEESEERLANGAAAYGGRFLGGFFVGGDSPFDEWAAQRRARLREQARLLFSRLAERQVREERIDEALQTASRYAALDPDDDAGRRQLGELLAGTAPPAPEEGPPARLERRRLTAVYCVLPAPAAEAESAALKAVAAGRQACRRILEGRGGQVTVSPCGDVVGYFGHPGAPGEQSGAAACAAARDLAAVPGPAEGVRIGVHSGAGLLSGAGHPDYLGTLTRVARAAAWAAPADDLRLTAAVTENLPAGQVVAVRAEVAEGPEGLFRVREACPAPAQGARWVGRRPQLASLLRRGRAVIHGTGSAVLIAGGPGMGKSRLVAEARRRLAPRLDVWEIRAGDGPVGEEQAGEESRGEGVPLAPVAALLVELLGVAERREAEARLEGWSGLTADHRRALLALYPTEKDPRATSGPEADPLPALEALIRSLAHAPLALVVEDMHRADEATADLVTRLAGLAGELPLLILVTGRPEGLPDWPGALRLDLPPLSLDEAERLAASVAGPAGLPPARREAVARRGEGVPLFVEEMARAWAAEGGADLPTGRLADLVTARLDRLGAAKRAAQLAALVGRGVSAAMLAAVDDRDPGTLATELDSLVAADLAQVQDTREGRFFRLKHDLVAEAVYATLPREERRALHAQVALAAEHGEGPWGPGGPDWLADQQERGGRPLAAARNRLRAARQSARLGSHQQSLAHLERARRLLAQGPASAERAELTAAVERFHTAQSLFPHGFHRAGEDSVPLEMEGEGFASLFARLLREVPEGRWWVLVERARQLLGLAEADGDHGEILTARHTLGVCADFAGDWPLAEEHLIDVLPAGLEGAPEWLVELYDGPPQVVEMGYRATMALHRGRPQEAAWAEGESVAEARRYGAPNLLGYALGLSAAYHRHAREPRAVLHRAREMVALGREEGLRVPRVAGLVYREWAKMAMGRGGLVRRAEAVARGEADSHGQGLLAGPVVHAYAQAGCWSRVVDLGRELLADGPGGPAPPTSWPEVWLHGGVALLQQGAAEEGTSWLREAIRVAEQAGDRLYRLRAAVGLARHWLATDRVEEAESLLAMALDQWPMDEAVAELTEARRLQRHCRPPGERS